MSQIASPKSRASSIGAGADTIDEYVMPVRENLPKQIGKSVTDLETLLDKWQ